MSRTRSTLAAIAAAAIAAAAIAATAACGSSTKKAQPGGASKLSGSVTVLAAASLTEAFNTIAKQFETANPGVKVKISYGASSALALQITQGAPVDVFASASEKNMKQVTDAKLAQSQVNFAKNVMEIAVPPSNPAHLTGVADLAKSGVKVALCQVQVPCGATAEKVFSKAKITVRPVTLEADVKSTLAKVESNEVDAGVVYVTDVRSAGSKVKGITIPSDVNASTAYPIATLSKAPNPAAAKAFVDYVLSSAGQNVLSADGFEQP